jgi:Family of unknown function (DUF6498)
MSKVGLRLPAFGKILPDMLAFAGGLGAAWFQHWKTTDLVWSLWLGSLVLGYLTILSTIGAGVYLGINVISHPEFPGKYRWPAVLIGTAVAVFLLGFFSLHFCGFHAGHATFLSLFFPLPGMPKNAFMNAFANPILLWKIVIKHLLPLYGSFLIPAIIAERKSVFASCIDAVKAVRRGLHQELAQDKQLARLSGQKPLKDVFQQPYRNVIRMHLLIFFFFFCHALKVDSFFVYAVVYFVYFFPWADFRQVTVEAEPETA